MDLDLRGAVINSQVNTANIRLISFGDAGGSLSLQPPCTQRFLYVVRADVKGDYG